VATVELRFVALPAHVRTARLIAGVLARRAGVHEAVIDEIKLAVGEACSRAVGVHARSCPDEQVVVRGVDGVKDFAGLPAFVVEVEDHGPAGEDVPRHETGGLLAAMALLDVDEMAEPDADADAPLPAGMRLAMIEGLVDNLQVTPVDGRQGTVVRMTWPLMLPDLEDRD
jgi:anti-sigma regulatory factor (Ser/Thr protein kinase)